MGNEGGPRRPSERPSWVHAHLQFITGPVLLAGGPGRHKYTQRCQVCAQQKSRTGLPLGSGHPLETPVGLFSSVSVDWLALPRTAEGFDKVALYVCRLSKLVKLVPCRATDTAKEQASLFWRNWVLEGRGFPEEIVSDRDALWANTFWQELITKAGVNLNLTTARHQSANGQAERSIRTAKEIVKMYADGNITDWVEAIAGAQSVMNNTTSAATGYTPLYLAYGWELDIDQAVDKSGRDDQVTERKRALSMAKRAIEAGRVRMKELLDRRRNQSVSVKVNDWVMLESLDLRLPGLSDRSRKTMPRYLGPYAVVEADDKHENYRLKLPRSMARVYPWHSIQKLKLYKTGVMAGISEQDLLDRSAIVGATQGQDTQGRAPAGRTDAETDGNGGEQWTVKRVMDHGQAIDGRIYKVLWEGYPASEATWEPERNLTAQSIVEYWETLEAQSSRGLGARGSGSVRKKRKVGQRPRGSVTRQQPVGSVAAMLGSL